MEYILLLIYCLFICMVQVPHAAPKVSQSLIAEQRAIYEQKKNASYRLLLSDDDDEGPGPSAPPPPSKSGVKLEKKREKHLR